MSKKAKAKTGPREKAGKKSRPMDASKAVVRLRVGRIGLASLLFAVLRPKDARAAAVNTNALRLTHGSRYTKIPLGDIVAAKVKTGWLWYGIRFRHAAGEAFVSGLSRDDARAFAEALVTARVHWWRRALAAQIATLRSVHDRLVQFANPPKYMTRNVFRELSRDAEKAAGQFAGRWPNTLSNAPEIRPLRTILDFLKDSDRLRAKANSAFVANELTRLREFFDRIEARPLTDEQRRAVVVDRFPRVRLGHAPTPLDPAPQLGATLGIELWIKRDDCTGLAFGGNKVRQLEFHLGEAQARGADTVLVTGAVQSNLVRLAAAGARRLGMDVDVQLEERVVDAGALHRASGNLLLGRLLGATLHAFPLGEDEAAADASLERRARVLADRGRRPYVIHSAPGHPPLGGLGYGQLNDAVREAMAMAARHEALLLDPVYTGKAVAGLVAHVRAGRIAAGSRVLFLHTGGLPALFAYADKLGFWLTKAPWAMPR